MRRVNACTDIASMADVHPRGDRSERDLGCDTVCVGVLAVTSPNRPVPVRSLLSSPQVATRPLIDSDLRPFEPFMHRRPFASGPRRVGASMRAEASAAPRDLGLLGPEVGGALLAYAKKQCRHVRPPSPSPTAGSSRPAWTRLAWGCRRPRSPRRTRSRRSSPHRCRRASPYAP